METKKLLEGTNAILDAVESLSCDVPTVDYTVGPVRRADKIWVLEGAPEDIRKVKVRSITFYITADQDDAMALADCGLEEQP